MTNNELMKLYIEDQKGRVNKSTLTRRCGALNRHYLPLFGSQEVELCDEENGFVMFNQMRVAGYSEPYIYSTYEALHSFYKYAVKFGLIAKNYIVSDSITKDYRRLSLKGYTRNAF